jgi:GMP synthase-like glutamine amidotransferase
MKSLIIKHVDIEGPGLIEYFLNQKRIPYRILSLDSDARLPKLEGFTHIVILGGPMNVYEEDDYPFLREEDLFIKEAIQRGKFVLGICLGAQLIAKALGAKVFKASLKRSDGMTSPDKVGSKILFPTFQRFPCFNGMGIFWVQRGSSLLPPSVPHQAFRTGML